MSSDGGDGIAAVEVAINRGVPPKSSLAQDTTTDLGEDGAASVQERDFKHKQVFKGWLLFWLAYQSTGVIYGDIGTSPLYVYSSTFTSPPSREDLLGALSLIIWTLTLIVSIKYVLIVLCADDEGEGGTFAVYSLLSRYTNIAQRDPRTRPSLKLERHESNQMKPANLVARAWLENSHFATVLLKVLAVLGVSLTMADGVLTPAQSVLGAIQGLEVVDPTISKGTIVGVSCAILALLFILQPMGISRLASGFAPVVIIWLGFNAAFGIFNLVVHDTSVLQAFSPAPAFDYLVRLGTEGWKSLGGILLAFTGVEALFADLGAFSKRAIQISWLGYAFPCLLLAYIGQAAYISDHPEAYSNPFFNTVPPGTFWPSLIISILAAIVASQALITATFQLLTQVMKMSYFPQIKTIHSSSTFHGQVYVPFANWLLGIGTIIVTAVYNNTTSLGHAYGVCVILVTFITTNMVALVALVVWRLNPILVFIVWLIFAALDGLYLSSALTKVPDGAWFTILLGVILASFFVLWRYGKEEQWKAEATDHIAPNRLVVQDSHNPSIERLSATLGGGEITNIKGLGVFFDKTGEGVPTAYLHFLSKFEAKPIVHVFLHLRALEIPTVPEEEKYTINVVRGIRQCYRVTIRYGYNDNIVTSELGGAVYSQVRRHLIRSSQFFKAEPSTEPLSASAEVVEQETLHQDGARLSLDGVNMSVRFREFEPSSIPLSALANQQDIETVRLVTALDKQYSTQVVYIVGKEELRILPPKRVGISRGPLRGLRWQDVCGPAAMRRVVLSVFLWIRENTRAKVANMKIPTDKLVEIGFVKDI